MNPVPTDLQQRLQLETASRHRELDRLIDRYCQLLVDLELLDLQTQQLNREEAYDGEA